jgi:hypothetical protein
MYRWVYIAEIPLVRRKLPVGVQIIPFQHHFQLLLAEVLVDQRQCQNMKRQVPRRVTGVVPFVWHRDDLGAVHVVPVLVTPSVPLWLEEIGAMLLEPLIHVVVVELLAPKHAC